MRLHFALLLATLASSAFAATTTVTKDPQAVSIIAQSLTNVGLTSTSAIQDLSATGTETLYWGTDQLNATLTVKSRGLTQFLISATLPDGTKKCVVSGLKGKCTEPDGQTSVVHLHNIFNFSSMTFPYLRLVIALNDPTVSITYVERIANGDQQIDRIKVQRIPASSDDPDGTLRKLQTADYFFDAGTSRLLSLQDNIHPEKGANQDVPRSLYFSDYRNVNGILMPFAIEERLWGQKTHTLQFASIATNVGLTDADFTY